MMHIQRHSQDEPSMPLRFSLPIRMLNFFARFSEG
ncbi:hypothetical protein E1A91_A12G175100v1 [Gossypium mustelinum]|uniref:Uncharacterized protein n=1 Tax=Gossypium mustelinum TaxID=34275 RepID=A0A5D2WVI2_GOSMU|nr:hypothetical protein E1A91_A12G175100v1 [Gossypium mustelinum]